MQEADLRFSVRGACDGVAGGHGRGLLVVIDELATVGVALNTRVEKKLIIYGQHLVLLLLRVVRRDVVELLQVELLLL